MSQFFPYGLPPRSFLRGSQTEPYVPTDRDSVMDIPGLMMWWDPSDPDVTELTGDNAISLLRDKGGLGCDLALDGISAFYPKVQANLLNGRPGMVCDGVGFTTQVPSSLSRASDLTVMMVWEPTAFQPSGDSYALALGSPASNGISLGFASGSGLRHVLAGGVGYCVQLGGIPSVSFSTPEVWELKYGSGTADMWLNGTQVAMSSYVGPYQPYTSIDLPSGLASYTGRIYEVLVWSRFLTTDEQEDKRAYLFEKWGF